MNTDKLRRKLFQILVDGTGYDEVPYEEINRPRYSWIKGSLDKYYDEIWEIMFTDD